MKFCYEGFSNSGGIYKITNTKNNKIYIGSAKEFKERWKQHKRSLISGKHHNQHLQRSFDKYGGAVFVFEVLEVVEGSIQDRKTIEQIYIDQYLDKWNMCFNLDRNAKMPRLKHSKAPISTAEKHSKNSIERWKCPHYRERLSKSFKESWTEERRRDMSNRVSGENNPRFNAIVSKETRKKISNSSINRWQDDEFVQNAKTIAKEQAEVQWQNPAIREKMKKALQGINSKTYMFLNPFSVSITISNLKKFCLDNNLSYSSMKNVAGGRQKQHRGWSLK